MINDRYLIAEVNGYYSKKLSEKEYESERLEKLAEKDERYSALKYELRRLKIEKQKAEFNGDGKKAAELLLKAKKTQDEFDRLKNGVVSTEAVPDCPLCGDSGYVSGAPCNCFIKRLTAAAYDTLGVTNIARHCFCDDKYSEKTGLSQVYSAIKRFTDKLPETDKNVLLLGQKGTGKTFLSECAANAAEEKDLCAIMITAFALNRVFVNSLSLPAKEKTTIDNILVTSDLLVIDDLGTEPVFNKVTIENLTAIISERLAAKKPFLVSTNLTLDEISARYGERLFSRLCGKQTVILKMNGKDLRLYDV